MDQKANAKTAEQSTKVQQINKQEFLEETCENNSHPMRKECAWQRMPSWLTETVWSAVEHFGYKMVLGVGDFNR